MLGIIEFGCAVFGLLFASPLIGVAALLIKLTSSGPAFYKQWFVWARTAGRSALSSCTSSLSRLRKADRSMLLVPAGRFADHRHRAAAT